MKITNTSQAPQGVETIKSRDGDNVVLGRTWLQPGQTRDLDVPENWAERNAGNGFFAIEGLTPKNQSKTIEDLNSGLDNERQRFNLQLNELDEKLIAAQAENTRLTNELTTSAAKIHELETQVTDLTAERDDLRSQVAAQAEPVDPKFQGLTTRHKGAGKYSIFNGADEELVSGLTKDESDEWALKSAEDQLAYVKGIVEANG